MCADRTGAVAGVMLCRGRRLWGGCWVYRVRPGPGFLGPSGLEGPSRAPWADVVYRSLYAQGPRRSGDSPSQRARIFEGISWVDFFWIVARAPHPLGRKGAGRRQGRNGPPKIEGRK